MTKRKYNIPAFLVGVAIWCALLWGLNLISDAIIDLVNAPAGGVVIIKVLIIASGVVMILAPSAARIDGKSK